MKTKNMRRFASLLLALVLALSLSVSAFAAIPADGSINATVKFYFDDYEIETVAVTMTSANATTSYSLPTLESNEYLSDAIVTGSNRPSVMDATLIGAEKATADENGEGGEPAEIGGWDRKYHEDTGMIEILGGYLDSIFATDNEMTDYLAPTENYDGFWKGNAWLYKVIDADGHDVVNPGPTFTGGVYATNVELEEGMTIIWTYYTDLVIEIPYEG